VEAVGLFEEVPLKENTDCPRHDGDQRHITPEPISGSAQIEVVFTSPDLLDPPRERTNLPILHSLLANRIATNP
jgi:hypothetical protein